MIHEFERQSFLEPIDYEQKHFCFVGVGMVGGALVGAGATAYGANKAASAQKDAAAQAAALAHQQYLQTRSDLSPYRNLGDQAAGQLGANLDYFTKPIQMGQAQLEQTPGYQFDLNQGLKAVQNSAALRGLGASGAALKGATQFATGLANKTYLDQFGVANTNQSNAFNRLYQLFGSGQNAAAGTGALGMDAAKTVGSAIIGGGNAQAAADNALGGAISKGANDIGGYYAYKGLFGNGGGGSSGGYGGGSGDNNASSGGWSPF